LRKNPLNMHQQGHLSALKTDSNPACMPRKAP
jgi:hypothetical protein